MKTIITLILAILANASFAQLVNYNIEPESDAVIVQDSIFIPIKNKKKQEVYAVYAFGNNERVRVFDPKTEDPLTFDGEYMYVHHPDKVAKYNRFTLEQIWSTDYGISKWSPQCPPTLLGDKYVVSVTDDHIVICDPETGKLLLDYEGRDFDCSVSLSDDNVICTKGNGDTFSLDVKSGDKLWSFDVGETSGFGSLTDGNQVYVTSWDPKFYCVDRETGKNIWTLNLKKIKNGCGSGFEELPVLKDDKLYAVHRDYGLFKIDKNTGEVLGNKDEFGEIVDNIELYKDNYLLFMDEENFYAFSLEEDKIVHKLALPFKMRTGFQLVGDMVVASQTVTYKGYDHKKGVISIDLKELFK